MIGDGELSKIEDVILISDDLSDEGKSSLDEKNRNLSNENYIHDNAHSNIRVISDITDLESSIKAAAPGTQMRNLSRPSNQFDNSVKFLKPQAPSNSISKSIIHDSNLSKNFRKNVSDSEISPIREKSVTFALDIDSSNETEISANTISVQMSEDELPELCRVCGDTNSGVHYGVVTCEGCKSFFKRAMAFDGYKKMVCLRNKQCLVLLGNRNKCQYCRLKKCQRVGMSQKAVVMGRRPRGKGSLDEVVVVELEDIGTCVEQKEDSAESTEDELEELGNERDEVYHDEDYVVPRGRGASRRRRGRGGTRAKMYRGVVASDVAHEMEKSRVKSKVLGRKRGRGRGNSMATTVTTASSSCTMVSSLSTSVTQQEPDSTLKLEHNPRLSLATYINSIVKSPIKTEHGTSEDGQPMLLVFEDKVMSFLGEKWHTAERNDQSSTSWTVSESPGPGKKRLQSSGDNLKVENYVPGQPSPKKQSNISQSSNNSPFASIHTSGQQLHHALGLTAPNSSTRDSNHLTAVLLKAYRDIFKLHIDAASKYSHNQINNLNENALNLLFGDQNWKVRDTVHINPHIQSITWDGFHLRFNEIIQCVVKFAKRIPGFNELDTDDRVNLVRGGCFEAACIIHCYYINEANDAWIGARDFVLIRSQMKLVMPLEESFIDQLFDYSTRFQQFHLGHAEMALMCALMLISPERPQLIHKDRVTRLQDDLTQALQQQVYNNHSNNLSLLPKVLMSTSSLRELSLEHRRQLSCLKGRFTFPHDLYAEMFDLT